MIKTNHHCFLRSLQILLPTGSLMLFLFLAQSISAQPIATTGNNDVDNCLSQTADNRPQWQDVGLQDILFAIGQPTVPAPNYVRLPYDYVTPQHCTILLPQYQSTGSKTGMPPGQLRKSTLYLWHFLRL